MKGNEIIEYMVRGDMPELEQIREICHRQAAGLPGKRRGRTRGVRPMIRRPALAGLVVFLCLLFASPALAANNPATYELLYSASPSVAQFFKPVQRSCENNGIRMEVIAAYIHDGTAEIFVSVQDLTGDRVDETTDLFDSYSINRPFSCSANCRFVSYDETNNTAVFLISITAWGDKKISGNKITFTVQKILSGKRIYDGIPVAVDMSNLPDNPCTMPLPEEYGGGADIGFQNQRTPTVLAPSLDLDIGVEGIAVTAMGYMDGLLHIQMSVGDNLLNDNHGDFYFKDANGGYVECMYSNMFAEIRDGERVCYYEFVYDIPRSQIGEYEVYGNFVAGGVITKGYWQVTFPLTCF